MRCVNSSYKVACLQCSFTDKELAEFIQFKKQSVEFERKKSVAKIGLQSDGTWVLSSNVYVSADGKLLDICESKFIWIGNFHSGPGIPLPSEQCTIHLPLATNSLETLMNNLLLFMGHNFLPTVMTIFAVILSLHYQTMLRKLKFCPIPQAFGESGTGKTTALMCGLSLLGIQEFRFYSKATKEKILQLLCDSGVPLGVDDPQSKSDISRLLIDLFNGAMSGTIKYGDKKPESICIIAANFTTIDQQR